LRFNTSTGYDNSDKSIRSVATAAKFSYFPMRTIALAIDVVLSAIFLNFDLGLHNFTLDARGGWVYREGEVGYFELDH
jgi:hypothetical protein